jgi:hypothetical protein
MIVRDCEGFRVRSSMAYDNFLRRRTSAPRRAVSIRGTYFICFIKDGGWINSVQAMMQYWPPPPLPGSSRSTGVWSTDDSVEVRKVAKKESIARRFEGGERECEVIEWICVKNRGSEGAACSFSPRFYTRPALPKGTSLRRGQEQLGEYTH